MRKRNGTWLSIVLGSNSVAHVEVKSSQHTAAAISRNQFFPKTDGEAETMRLDDARGSPPRNRTLGRGDSRRAGEAALGSDCRRDQVAEDVFSIQTASLRRALNISSHRLASDLLPATAFFFLGSSGGFDRKRPGWRWPWRRFLGRPECRCSAYRVSAVAVTAVCFLEPMPASSSACVVYSHSFSRACAVFTIRYHHDRTSVIDLFEKQRRI